jgi:hypothetical protein
LHFRRLKTKKYSIITLVCSIERIFCRKALRGANNQSRHYGIITRFDVIKVIHVYLMFSSGENPMTLSSKSRITFETIKQKNDGNHLNYSSTAMLTERDSQKTEITDKC